MERGIKQPFICDPTVVIPENARAPLVHIAPPNPAFKVLPITQCHVSQLAQLGDLSLEDPKLDGRRASSIRSFRVPTPHLELWDIFWRRLNTERAFCSAMKTGCMNLSILLDWILLYSEDFSVRGGDIPL